MSRWEAGMCALAFILGGLMVYGTAKAEPRYTASVQGVQITLYDEPCKLDAVANLPHRATWTEQGKTFEGCFHFFEHVGLIVAYFADKSVAPMPPQIFKPLTNG
jgi:hypothetical protein